MYIFLLNASPDILILARWSLLQLSEQGEAWVGLYCQEKGGGRSQLLIHTHWGVGQGKQWQGRAVWFVVVGCGCFYHLA